MHSIDLFATAFENARTALLLLDKGTGRVLEVNAAFLRMCGRARGAVAGHRFWQPPLIADAQAGAEIFEHLRAGGSVEGAELPLETGDGSRLLVNVTGKELTGGVVQLEVEDVMARESARRVERMDAQRLLAKRVAAELARIQGAVEAAGETRAGAGTVVRELLAYSEQLVLEPRSFALNELIEAMRPALERLLGPDIGIVLELSPDAAPVMADPAQVRQILLKLAANSREAIEHGGIFRIETCNASANDPALARADEEGAYTVLAVSDNGPGLDDESWAHLYEPFFTTKAHGKRGLGLAAVHGIVRQSGGRLWADSAPGQGTWFRIYLPRAMANSPALPAAAPALLLVEENDGLRAVVTSILKKRGYRVLPVRERRDALEIAKAQGVPALFLSGAPATLKRPFEVETLLEKVRELLVQQ
jgi:PAS domain S-box-containing protein